MRLLCVIAAARSRLSIGGGPGPAEAASALATAASLAAMAASSAAAAASTSATAGGPRDPPQRPPSASAPSPSTQPGDFYRPAPATPYTQRLLIPGTSQTIFLSRSCDSGIGFGPVPIFSPIPSMQINSTSCQPCMYAALITRLHAVGVH